MSLIYYYVAFVHPTPDQRYSVVFPDFPGCTGTANSYSAVHHMVAELLAKHVETLDSLPEPRTPRQIFAEDQGINSPETITINVPLNTRDKPVGLTLLLDRDLVAQMDAVASNRSEVITAAVKYWLDLQSAGPRSH